MVCTCRPHKHSLYTLTPTRWFVHTDPPKWFVHSDPTVMVCKQGPHKDKNLTHLAHPVVLLSLFFCLSPPPSRHLQFWVTMKTNNRLLTSLKKIILCLFHLHSWFCFICRYSREWRTGQHLLLSVQRGLWRLIAREGRGWRCSRWCRRRGRRWGRRWGRGGWRHLSGRPGRWNGWLHQPPGGSSGHAVQWSVRL